MFIGSKEIRATFDDANDMLKVELDDDSTTLINKDLLALIQTEEKGDGNITDSINHYFATRFLAELAMYDLNYYFIDNVGTAMSVLAHNLREELIKKTFDCSGGNDIRLKTLINSTPLTNA